MKTYQEVKNAVLSHGFRWFSGELSINCVWERTSNIFTNRMTDWFHVCWVENGVPKIISIPATTKPGLKGSILSPITVDGVTGTAVIIAPQQVIGGWSFVDRSDGFSGHPYFAQVGAVDYHRDGNKDTIYNEVQEQDDKYFGTCWHRMSPLDGYGSGEIDNWSLGCCGAATPEWDKILPIVRRSVAKYGPKVTGTFIPSYKEVVHSGINVHNEKAFPFYNQIRQVPLPDGQYVKEVHEKTMGFLHATVSWFDGARVVAGWSNDNRGAVGTEYVISGMPMPVCPKAVDGEVIQCVNSNYAIYDLGLRKEIFAKFGLPFKQIDLNSIGVEICCPGPAKKTDKGYEACEHIFDEKDIQYYPVAHRGNHYWVKFTPKQIDSTCKLILYLEQVHGIPSEFRGMGIFDLDPRALRGEPGWYTHCSVQPASVRSDIPPQPDMVYALEHI